MSSKQKKILYGICIALFFLLMVAICWFAGKPLVKFASEPEKFRSWLDSLGIWGRVVFVGIIILQVFIAFIPGEPFEIGAGYAFGPIEGTLLCLVGALIGSFIVFSFVRRFGVQAVEVFFSREKIESVKFLKDAKRRDLLIFIVFFIPGTPKDLLTYFAGLTGIKLSKFLLLSTIARLPSVITSAVGGDAIGVKNYVFAIIVFAVTAILSAVGIWIYIRISKKHEDNI